MMRGIRHWLAVALVMAMSAVWLGMSAARAESGQTAAAFLQAVRDNKPGQAIRLFASEKTKSPPRGGYEAYFRYEDGAEPNLAFLLTQPFLIEKPRVTEHLDDSFCFTPLDCGEGETVEVPVQFADKTRSPVLLPSALALGYRRYTETDLLDFAKNPLGQRQGISLQYEDTLTFQLRPADSWLPPVYGANGHPLSAVTVKQRLPRLKRITVSFYMTREGKLSPWKVQLFKVKDPVLW